MTTVKFPPFLAVEEEDEDNPEDRYGPPMKKHVIVKFGDHEVARWTMDSRPHDDGEFYYLVEGSNWPVRYDSAEEFLAHKLRKLFKQIG